MPKSGFFEKRFREDGRDAEKGAEDFGELPIKWTDFVVSEYAPGESMKFILNPRPQEKERTSLAGQKNTLQVYEIIPFGYSSHQPLTSSCRVCASASLQEHALSVYAPESSHMVLRLFGNKNNHTCCSGSALHVTTLASCIRR